MDKNDNIKKTLDSLNDMQIVPLKPFFYTRLESRMEKVSTRNRWQKSISWAVVIVLVVLNLGAYFSFNQSTNESSNSVQLTDVKTQYYPETDNYYALIEEYETK